MKKIFTIAALLCAGVAAQAQYVTPALNPETFEYDQFDWDHAHNFVIIGACEAVVAEMEAITDHGIYKDIRPNGETNFFYVWDEQTNEIRLVTSWDTTEADIDSFINDLKKITEK